MNQANNSPSAASAMAVAIHTNSTSISRSFGGAVIPTM